MGETLEPWRQPARPDVDGRAGRHERESGLEAEQPSDRIVEQRIRNRVIEYFEMVSSLAAQQAYEEKGPPFVNVPYEIINQWEDWIPNDPRSDIKPLSVFSPEEMAALGEYQGVWEKAADELPDDYPELLSVQSLPGWEQLTRSAGVASEVFGHRGRMPEDREVD